MIPRIAQIRSNAFRDLHEHAKIPALFYATRLTTPIEVDIRIHTRAGLGGDMDYITGAQRVEANPKIKFMTAQISPTTVTDLSFFRVLAANTVSGVDEIYKADSVGIIESIQCGCECSKLSPEQVAQFIAALP